MYRLIRLLLGWALASYGFSLIAQGDVFAGYRLRDGLIVATLGALLFAWDSFDPAWPAHTPGRSTWPFAGRLLLLTGLGCSLAAALLLAVVGATGWLGLLAGLLWGLGSMALLVGLLWPGQMEIYPAPPFRWRVDAAGRWVRFALGDADATDATDVNAQLRRVPHPASLPQRAPIYGLMILLILGIGIGVRLWRLSSLPPTCIEIECGQALQLVEGSGPVGFTVENASLFTWLSRWAWRLTGDSVAALRWASALLGVLFLPVWLWAVRPLTQPAGALVGLATMALLPWALWTSRFGSAWSAVPLLATLAMGFALRGAVHQTRRWWGLTGVALGLLWIQPTDMQQIVLVWLIFLSGIAWWQGGRTPAPRLEQAGVLVASALTVGLPLALPTLLSQWANPGLWNSGGPSSNDVTYLAGLLHSGGDAIDYFLQNPLLPAVVTGGAWCGLARLTRWAMRPMALLLLGSALTLLFGMLWLSSQPPEVLSAAHYWLLWLPLAGWGIALAADQGAWAFDWAWARLVPLPRAVTVTVVALLILMGQQLWTLSGQLDFVAGSAQDGAQAAMTQYLAQCLRTPSDDLCRQTGEDAPIFFAPPAVVNDPSMKLLLADALRAGRIRALDPARDILPTITPPGDYVYLVALDNTPVLDLLQQLYPDAPRQLYPQDQPGPTQFMTLHIPRTRIMSHQGVVGRYYAGSDPNAEGAEVVSERQEGPLAFGWAGNAPVAAPFHARWEGTLLVPAAGRYTFSVLHAPELSSVEPSAVISLQLDNNLVLDTSLGLTEQEIVLPQGYVSLVLHYRTDDAPGDWAVRWTLPSDGAEPTPIPRQALYSPTLPNIGLLGTYYAGTSPQGPALTTRKDLILSGEADLPMPYSVRWTGNLAAARAGEYLFAVSANGPVNLILDGEVALAHLPPERLSEGPGFSQTSIYLAQGWHEIEMTYVPQGVADLRLLWQPPGSTPSLLLSRQLLPVMGEALALDYALPDAPMLLDERLGNNRFALTANMDFAQPERVLPPASLSRLLAEPIWSQNNGCGNGPEQLDSPRGVAFDQERGRLYVADANNQRVAVLDAADGTWLETIEVAGWQEPVDVTLAPDGTLLVLDTIVPSIFRVDLATGEAVPLALTSGFYRPRGLAVDATGNIAVADTGGARVVLLDPLGNQLAQFGGQQSILGQGQPVDTLSINDVWWVVTADNGRLWRLDVLGSLAPLSRASTVTGPHLAALGDGGFFLSSPAQRAVIYHAPSGEPLAQLAYPDQLMNPTGIAAAFRTDNTALVDLAIADSASCGVSLWRLRPR